MKIKLISILITPLMSFPSYAGSTSADYARSAISLGRVATQCGISSTPPIKVPSQTVISYAIEFSGLSYPKLMQAIKGDLSQSKINQEVSDLQIEIKRGKITCSSVLSLLYRGATNESL